MKILDFLFLFYYLNFTKKKPSQNIRWEMKLIIAFIIIFQVSSIPTRLDVFISNGANIIFFENINFKDKKIPNFRFYNMKIYYKKIFKVII